MARKRITLKVPAFNIIETIMAMVVIVIVCGIAMLIFGRVMQSGVSMRRWRAAATLKDALLHAEKRRPIADTSFINEDFFIEESVSPYQGTSGLLVIRFTAYAENKEPVLSKQKIVPANE
jgi:hypothetical protein